MADLKISQLTAATTLAAADLIPVVQGGANKKAAASLVLNAVTSRTAVADVDKTVAATDSFIAYSSLTLARVVTLPAASAVPAGWELVVMDESGSCSATVTITVTRAGADTIDGATTKVINVAYGGVRLFSDGTSKWSFTATGALLAANNLSDIGTAATARTNLGLGSMATQAATAVAITGGAIDGTTVGATTASSVKASTISATGQVTSTLATGTAPLVIASTTNVANLNASSLAGATFAAPGPIGSGTPSTIAGTTLAASGATTFTATTDSTSTSTGGVVLSGGLGVAKNLNIGGSFSGPIHNVADAIYTVTASDHYVFMTSITASRAITLPAASAVPAGYRVTIADVSGSVTLAIVITITAAGVDTIDGAATEVIKAAYGSRILVSDGSSKWFFDGGVARVSGATMTGQFAPAVFALTDAATIAVDASKANVFTVTLGGSRTIANPTSAVNGQTITFILTQDGTGSRIVTWDTQYRFSVSQPQPVLSTAAAKIDRVAFTYNSANTKWDVSGYSLGYT